MLNVVAPLKKMKDRGVGVCWRRPAKDASIVGLFLRNPHMRGKGVLTQLKLALIASRDVLHDIII